jgi:hypothetical protein
MERVKQKRDLATLVAESARVENSRIPLVKVHGFGDKRAEKYVAVGVLDAETLAGKDDAGCEQIARALCTAGKGVWQNSMILPVTKARSLAQADVAAKNVRLQRMRADEGRLRAQLPPPPPPGPPPGPPPAPGGAPPPSATSRYDAVLADFGAYDDPRRYAGQDYSPQFVDDLQLWYTHENKPDLDSRTLGVVSPILKFDWTRKIAALVGKGG